MKIANYKICIYLFFSVLIFNCAGHKLMLERWIQTDDLFKINMDMTSDEVIIILGEPLYLEVVSDEDEETIIMEFIYNFRTKKYNPNSLDNQIKIADNTWGRTTSIKFTFINDRLTGWEEERHILSMAKERKKTFSLPYWNILLNLILAIKVFSL